MGVSNIYLVFSVLLMIFLELTQYLNEKHSLFTRLLRQPVYIRWSLYYFALFIFGAFGVFVHRQFIYFQF